MPPGASTDPAREFRAGRLCGTFLRADRAGADLDSVGHLLRHEGHPLHLPSAAAYGEFRHDSIYGEKDGVYCHSKIYGSEEFGYNKIVVERPLRDENGEIILKKGQPVADANLRDTENVPLVEDIDAFFVREVLPYAPDAWIDKKKTKVGYEIPMTRYFYEYQAPEPVEDIVARIRELEAGISASLNALFPKED